MASTIRVPNMPSECVAALSLSEDGAAYPYVSIFYTVTEGTIYFYGLLVVGVEEVEEEKRLLFSNGCLEPTSDPDATTPYLIEGELHPTGQMFLGGTETTYFKDEAEAITFIAVMRAVYQMQGELAE